ncbi:uncharacterized protein LOC135823744 [Sycon ciliatum]|uniref:uncharacterized protein LOC135823744 n=1 Tax=Sycon ciliatum TaxID=27933 RepID=UPI0020A904E4
MAFATKTMATLILVVLESMCGLTAPIAGFFPLPYFPPPAGGPPVPKWSAGELNAPILYPQVGSHHAGFLIFGPSVNKPITEITVHCETTKAAPQVAVSGRTNSIIQDYRPIAQVTVTGLQPSTEYVCYYTATNIFGTSMRSLVSGRFITSPSH